jgi:hypothetical protein
VKPLDRGRKDDPDRDRHSQEIRDQGDDIVSRQRMVSRPTYQSEHLIDTDIDIYGGAFEHDPSNENAHEEKENQPAKDDWKREPPLGAVDAAFEGEQIPVPVRERPPERMSPRPGPLVVRAEPAVRINPAAAR